MTAALVPLMPGQDDGASADVYRALTTSSGDVVANLALISSITVPGAG